MRTWLVAVVALGALTLSLHSQCFAGTIYKCWGGNTYVVAATCDEGCATCRAEKLRPYWSASTCGLLESGFAPGSVLIISEAIGGAHPPASANIPSAAIFPSCGHAP